jgi:hypothetical protein
MMDWGNMIIKKVVKENDKIVLVEAILNLDGDFKKTKQKLTWLSADAEKTDIIAHDYDFLITKKKLETESTKQYLKKLSRVLLLNKSFMNIYPNKLALKMLSCILVTIHLWI